MTSLPRPGVSVPVAADGEARSGTRLAGMDGLRGIAAVMVVINHTGLYAIDLGPGGVADTAVRQLAGGVLLFFSLSGLLLYRPFAAAILGTGPTPTIGTYARNRVLRILPAYWVILFLTTIAGATLVPHPDRLLATGTLLEHPRALAADALLVHNYAPSTFMTGIGPAWTLAIEAVFYVVLPIVSLGVIRLTARHVMSSARRPFMVFIPPLVLLVVGLAGKAAARKTMGSYEGGWSRNWPSVLARSFVANADLFAYGMALAAIVVLVDAGQLELPRWWRGGALGAALIAAMTAVSIGEFGEYPYDVLAVIAASLVLAVIVLGTGPGEQQVRAVLSSPAFVATGLVSYSLYLWHEPVIAWFADRDVFPLSGFGGFLGALIIVGLTSGILSAGTYRLVERPALDRKRTVTGQARR